MKITIQSTNKISKLKGVSVREWTGITESGIKVRLQIAVVACSASDQHELEKELIFMGSVKNSIFDNLFND